MAHGAATLTQASITNIERGLSTGEGGKRGGRAVTVDELLVLAYVLDARIADLLVPDDGSEFEPVPGVVVHPFAASTWLEGRSLHEPSIWGPEVSQVGAGSFRSWVYETIEYLYGQLKLERELKGDGEDLSPVYRGNRNIYAGRLLQLGVVLQNGDQKGVELPPLPAWLLRDLRAAETSGQLREPEYFDDPTDVGVPIRRMRPAGKPIRLPRNLTVMVDSDAPEDSHG